MNVYTVRTFWADCKNQIRCMALWSGLWGGPVLTSGKILGIKYGDDGFNDLGGLLVEKVVVDFLWYVYKIIQRMHISSLLFSKIYISTVYQFYLPFSFQTL